MTLGVPPVSPKWPWKSRGGAGATLAGMPACEFWFPVHQIFGMVEPAEPMVYLAEKQLGNISRAVKTLHCLQQVVHNKHVINFYEEENQDVEKVVNIFIRTNSGGTVLSYSDFNTLVDALNDTGMGFNFSTDFVLKAGLMLSDIASVGFKVENLAAKM